MVGSILYVIAYGMQYMVCIGIPYDYIVIWYAFFTIWYVVFEKSILDAWFISLEVNNDRKPWQKKKHLKCFSGTWSQITLVGIPATSHLTFGLKWSGWDPNLCG